MIGGKITTSYCCLVSAHRNGSSWNLKAGEVHKLLGHIAGLYRQYKREGLPRGKTHFLKIDTAATDHEDFSSADLSRLLETMARAGVDVATRVFEWMANAENASDILDQLGRLQASSLQQINSLVGITNLRALYQLWEENRSNKNEEFWQKTFQQHSFALTQLFAFPVILFRGKAYVGGKGLENTGGNIVDFLAVNHLTRNALLIEIKTPLTALLGGEYRRSSGIYSASDDFTGAISQVLSYRHSLQRTGEQRWFLLQWSSRRSGVVLPPPLSVGVRWLYVRSLHLPTSTAADAHPRTMGHRR